MKKIAFLVLHLGFGGTEQAVISEANLLVDRYEVEIICFYKLLEKPAFQVNSKVKIRYLTHDVKPNKEEIQTALTKKDVLMLLVEGVKSLKILYLRTSMMKQAIKESDADVIISSRYFYHKLLVRNARKHVVCIAQEHNHHNGNNKYINKQIDAVKNMDYFMPVSKELTEFYDERLKPYKVKCKYISHYLEEIPKNSSRLQGKNIISVGRLSSEKDFEELIHVFSELNDSFNAWKLHIIGDGEEKRKLQETIHSLHLADRVVLHGFQNKEYIGKMMCESSVYVMTSLTESFGLVLIEAQSYGLPCIAYDSAQGAQEIIESGENGILIANRSRKDMVAELEKLMSDFAYRTQIGESGKKSSLRYSKENIAIQWFEFIDNLRKE